MSQNIKLTRIVADNSQIRIYSMIKKWTFALFRGLGLTSFSIFTRGATKQ